jgi:lactoylglutathione lyase
MRWTHIAIPVSDMEGSIRFFTEVCGLSVVRDRRLEGGSTVWLGPMPTEGEHPEFVIVLIHGEVREPLDHFGFECASREEVTALADRAKAQGPLVDGPTDSGGSVGYWAVVREPSGHLVEFTHQMRGRSGRKSPVTWLLGPDLRKSPSSVRVCRLGEQLDLARILRLFSKRRRILALG